jgi:hypothetical protein
MPKTKSKSQERREAVQGKELLDLDSSIVATSIFFFEAMKMDKFLQWSIKMTLKTQLPQSFRDYKVKLSFNEEPLLVKIQDLERKMANVESENQLFEGNKKTQIKNIKEEISEIEQELKDSKNQTPEIEFEGTIEKLEYKNADTVISLWIPAMVANQINDVRDILKTYKIELIRE